jgi:hypothetical protein
MISKRELKKIRNRLPKGYGERLQKKYLEKNPDNKISVSLIRMIMNGQRKDYYGIYDLAIEDIREEKERQEIKSKQLSEQINKL